VAGNWKEWKGRAKQTWGDLTDDDLTRITGRRDELQGLLQQRYGWSQERARNEYDNFIRTWESYGSYTAS
jgi:uncharacterized protein YjbJ (UPF0337 family)